AGRGQRRPRLLGERAVLEPGDRQIVRHFHAQRARRVQGARRNFVIGSENGGRGVGQRQQLARAAEAVVERIVAFHDQGVVPVDAIVAQRVDVAVEALGTGAVLLAAPEETDALVPQADQVLDDVVGGAAIVDVYARAVVAGIAGG